MPYEGDPIADAMDLAILAGIGIAVYFLYQLYENPDSAIAQGACNSLGVGCAPGVVPTSGLGAWAWQAGWWWGSASDAISNAPQSISNAASSAASAASGAGSMIGSVFTGGPTNPNSPTVGLPAGYDPTTGMISSTQ